jgi:MoaA/NifB/PqqE/SkfB family radical SAM enzyme
MSEKPTIVLMVNDKEACNMSCTHCYLPYEGSREPEDVVQLVEKLKSDYKLVIAGSETLVDLGYLEAYEKAGQKYILTNGVLLAQKPEIYDELKEHGIEEIRISLHFGIQKDLHSVPEAVVRKVVKEAKERDFEVQVSITVTPENYHLVHEMCKEAHEMNADTIGFLKYLKLGSAVNEDRDLLSVQQREEFFKLIQQARAQYEKDVLEICLHGNFGPRKGSKGEILATKNEYCPAGNKTFAIDPEGNIYGCPFLMNEPIGSLTENFKLNIVKVLCNGERHKCLTDV